MTYLDYSATTKINEEVLKEVKQDLLTKITEEELTPYKNQIQKLLNTDLEVFITSGSSESNNWAIKGICKNNEKRTILTTKLEHSSINETLKYLEKQGFKIEYLPLQDGIIDINELEKLITNDVSLITVASVNSETGALQPVNEIGKIAKKHNIPFHCDMTQSIGKINIPLDNIDLLSLSAHKFYGPKGIGLLLKNSNLKIEKLVYGKRVYNLGLIKGLIKALELSQKDLEENYKKVEDLNLYLIDKFKSLPNIIINKSKNSIPHILNISVLNYKPETFLHYLELNDIYISTKSACSTSNSYSEAVYVITGDKKRAETSVRISLSAKTTKEDLDNLIKVIERNEHAR